MCCNNKTVEVIDSSSRYSHLYRKQNKSLNDILVNQHINNNNQNESSSKRKLSQKAEEATEKQNYSEAIAIYKEIISVYPNDENFYFKLGKIYLQLKLFSEALDIFTKAIEINKIKYDSYEENGIAKPSKMEGVSALYKLLAEINNKIKAE